MFSTDPAVHPLAQPHVPRQRPEKNAILDTPGDQKLHVVEFFIKAVVHKEARTMAQAPSHRPPADCCERMAGPCSAAWDAVISADPVLARLVAGDSEKVGSGYPLR